MKTLIHMSPLKTRTPLRQVLKRANSSVAAGGGGSTGVNLVTHTVISNEQ
jgi:hypothetical protein